jgi:3-methyladenine DNA glycosylase AlkD
VVKLRSTIANRENISSDELAALENEIVARLSSLSVWTTESIRSVRREVSRRLAKTSAQSMIVLALRLTRRQIVPRFFAYELVQHHLEALRSLKAKSLEDLGRGNDNWGAVDAFACYLAGPVWRERQVADALIRRWARSRDRWWRRAALVSTVALNSKARGGSGDTVRTLNICKLLVTDRDDMVVKALSWALRELSKRDPESVRRFLNEHRAVLAPRVVREVSNKLQTGLKNPRRRKTNGAL